MHAFELISHYTLSVTPIIHCLASKFVLNKFNLLIYIAVMSLNKPFHIYVPEREGSNDMVKHMKFNICFPIVTFSLIC